MCEIPRALRLRQGFPAVEALYYLEDQGICYYELPTCGFSPDPPQLPNREPAWAWRKKLARLLQLRNFVLDVGWLWSSKSKYMDHKQNCAKLVGLLFWRPERGGVYGNELPKYFNYDKYIIVW